MNFPATLSRSLAWITGIVGSVLAAGFVYMVHDPLGRPFYIDEMVYAGQYLHTILSGPRVLYWSVDAKQPLFFWICEAMIRVLPGSVAEGPRVLIAVPRLLSALCCAAAPAFAVLIARPSDRRWVHWAAGYAVFCASPFYLIHAQLGIVEPLLILGLLAVLWASDKFLRENSLAALAILCLADGSFILIKTNALIPLLALALVLAGFAMTASSRPYRAAANVHLVFWALGYLFAKAMPGVSMESARVFEFTPFYFARIWKQAMMHAELLRYFMPYFAWPILLASAAAWGAFFRNNRGWSDSVVACLTVSGLSFVICLAGLQGDSPRYYVFSFIPLMVVVVRAFCALLDRFDETVRHPAAKGATLAALVVLLGSDLVSAAQIFHDRTGANPRIHRIDKRQYYDRFAVESMRGIEDYILSNDAEIYAMDPPYMESMIVRGLLGTRESRKRLKLLPRTVPEINRIVCDPRFGATLVLMGNWYFTPARRNAFTGMVKVRDYRANRRQGVGITLFRKSCG